MQRIVPLGRRVALANEAKTSQAVNPPFATIKKKKPALEPEAALRRLAFVC